MSKQTLEKSTLRDPPQTVPTKSQIITTAKNNLLKKKRNTQKPAEAKSPTKTQKPSQPPTTPTPAKKDVKPKPKRLTLKQVVLAVLKEHGSLNREKLIDLAIEKRKPVSQRPRWVYGSVCLVLAEEGKVIITREKPKTKFHIVSLP